MPHASLRPAARPNSFYRTQAVCTLRLTLRAEAFDTSVLIETQVPRVWCSSRPARHLCLLRKTLREVQVLKTVSGSRHGRVSGTEHSRCSFHAAAVGVPTSGPKPAWHSSHTVDAFLFLQYSFSLTTFSPSGKLVQIEYALNAVEAGATSLGIKATNGVVIATERKVSTPPLHRLLVPAAVSGCMQQVLPSQWCHRRSSAVWLTSCTSNQCCSALPLDLLGLRGASRLLSFGVRTSAVLRNCCQFGPAVAVSTCSCSEDQCMRSPLEQQSATLALQPAASRCTAGGACLQSCCTVPHARLHACWLYNDLACRTAWFLWGLHPAARGSDQAIVPSNQEPHRAGI